MQSFEFLFPPPGGYSPLGGSTVEDREGGYSAPVGKWTRSGRRGYSGSFEFLGSSCSVPPSPLRGSLPQGGRIFFIPHEYSRLPSPALRALPLQRGNYSPQQADEYTDS